MPASSATTSTHTAIKTCAINKVEKVCFNRSEKPLPNSKVKNLDEPVPKALLIKESIVTIPPTA